MIQIRNMFLLLIRKNLDKPTHSVTVHVTSFISFSMDRKTYVPKWTGQKIRLPFLVHLCFKVLFHWTYGKWWSRGQHDSCKCEWKVSTCVARFWKKTGILQRLEKSIFMKLSSAVLDLLHEDGRTETKSRNKKTSFCSYLPRTHPVTQWTYHYCRLVIRV